MSSTQRNYSINFATTADLTAAAATEKAVSKVGDAATQTSSKLEIMEREYKESMARIKAKLDSAQASLRESGEQGGKAAGEGMGQGLNLAANLHLVQQAWAIGSKIGDSLSKALIAAYDGNMEDLGTDILAWFGVQSALIDQELERQKETLPAKHREIHAAVLREYRAFWDKYNGVTPQTTGEWLDELGKKADLAAVKLRALTEVQNTALKMGKSAIEQDFLDEKLGIEMSSDPESVKARKIAGAEAEKRRREAAMREHQRTLEKAGLEAGVLGKEKEYDDVWAKEVEKERQAKAATEAKKRADAEIKGRKEGGQKMTDEDEFSTRKGIYDSVGRNYGVSVDQKTDYTGELEALKKRRVAAEEALVKARAEAAGKTQSIDLEGAADKANSAREEARAQRVADDKIHKARRQEMEEEAKQKKIREDDDAAQRAAETARTAPPPTVPQPGQEQTPAGSTEDLQGALSKIAANTGNSGLKMDAEALKRALSDGGSADELKEAAALMERASTDRNDTVRAMAQTMRTMVDAQNSAMASIRQEMAALRATVEAGKNNS